MTLFPCLLSAFLLAVTLLTFLVASLLPGDLASTILGDQATPEKVAALRAQMGLDLPIWQRYGLWLWDVLILQGFRPSGAVYQDSLHARSVPPSWFIFENIIDYENYCNSILTSIE